MTAPVWRLTAAWQTLKRKRKPQAHSQPHLTTSRAIAAPQPDASPSLKTGALWASKAFTAITILTCLGCSQPRSAEPDSSGGTPTERPPTESTSNNRRSNTVTVLGVIVGDQQAKLEAAIAPFEAETGIDVIYEGTDAFSTLLPVRVESGDAPDVAMFPQPGLMRSLAEEGALVPLNSFLSKSQLQMYYPDSWIALSEVTDQQGQNNIYGVWYRSSVKSLVWYVPEEFEQHGYNIPATWEEMIDLSDRMVADGVTPWCLGLESGNASGWPGTDWIEEIMLRTAGPQGYDQWVNHEIPFDDTSVQTAFNYFGEIVQSPGYLWGGAVGALSIPFGDSATGLFNNPPNCLMHRQANFITGFFPSDITLGQDVDFFPTPNINPQYQNALLVGGDLFSMLRDTPEARKLMAYLATPTPHEIWAKAGGFLSPNKQVSLSSYPDDLSRKQAELLTSADIIRFDGSDAMPGAVGTGTFWSGMMDFVSGKSAESVTEKIEFYWPKPDPTDPLEN